ncbi:SARP family transcriptional regulator [Eggerthellaceae bacterium zg-893]|nr:SARP family transcriptional regulator [Eggerthellaceae bacterium zg-893]
MPNFLLNAACNGSRPRRVPVLERFVSRPALIARLMRERHVARFIVAPPGFGKTSVALEYAETVFRFESVFWIDGSSPCFLRDLDKGILAATLLSRSRGELLMVIDDVPLLDLERSEALSREIDAVLDSGGEALLTCVPAHDGFERHRDRILLHSRDLLLTDDECDEMRTPQDRKRRPSGDIGETRRVAAVAWHSPAEPEPEPHMLADALREDMPASIKACLFALLALVEGSLADVRAAVGCTDEDLAHLELYYSYAGINSRLDAFKALDVEPTALAAAFSAHLASIAQTTRFDEGELLRQIADLLLQRRKPERACGLMRTLAPKRLRASWLHERATALMDAGCLQAPNELYESLGKEALHIEPDLALSQAIRLLLLEDPAEALPLARRAMGLGGASVTNKVVATLVAAQCLTGSDRDQALDQAKSLVPGQMEAPGRRGWPESEPISQESLHALVALAASPEAPPAAKIRLLSQLADGQAPRSMVMAATAAVLGDMDPTAGGSTDASARLGDKQALRRIGAAIGAGAHVPIERDPTLFEGLAAGAFDRMSAAWGLTETVWDEAWIDQAHRMEDSLYAQRASWSSARRRSTGRRSGKASKTGSWNAERQSSATGTPGNVEKLRVKLFGGLEVYRGRNRIDPMLFRRRNVRVLLALLVLNHGREISRDRLIRQMWPNSNPDCGRRNFYSVWSLLKQALSTEPHRCPYLIRQQLGVRLDATLLESDAMEHEQLCQRLLFESPDAACWADLYQRVASSFSEDLLPGEGHSPALNALRREYRTKLADAMASASMRLLKAGRCQEALWFARDAHQRDAAREDLCGALMRCQIAAGQRTAAIETYHDCRRRLADELGIDPSMETMQLYNQVIEAEEAYQ